jgi:hypothetical protein
MAAKGNASRVVLRFFTLASNTGRHRAEAPLMRSTIGWKSTHRLVRQSVKCYGSGCIGK